MGKIHELVKQKNKLEVSKAIRNGESPNERDNYYNTPLHIACGASPDTEMVKILLRAKADVNVQDRNGWTPLHCSASSAQLSICELLLTVEGIDVGVLNKDGTSVLHYLVRANPAVHEIQLYKNVLKLYVEKRGDINAQSKHGEAALHQACLRANVTAVKFLLENKAAVNILNKISETALHYAIRSGNKECVQLLLEYGIDTSIKPEVPQDSEIAALITQFQKKLPATIATSNDTTTHNDDNTAGLPNISELKLRIKILRARDLTPVADKENANSYCQIIFNKQRKNTKVKPNTLNPSWDEVFLFDIEDLNYPIKISLYENDCNNIAICSDKDPSKEDLLGSVSIYLKDTPLDKTGQGIPCQSSYVLKRIPRREGSRNKPKVRIELSFLLKCKLVEETEAPPAEMEKVSIETSGEGDSLRTSSGVSVGAFGRKRGKCKTKGCDCDAYQPESANGGQCQNCGHWPAQHENLGTTSGGTIPSGTSSPNQSLTGSSNLPISQNQSVNSPATAAASSTDINEISSRFQAQPASILTHNWEISSNELQFSRRLGEGTSAQVFYGTYRSQEVAIKVLKEKAEAKVAEEFAKECEIMKNLRSPHVVFFYGACLQPSMCMVLEFCHKGSLYDVLNNAKEDITWKKVFKAARDTIKGLLCLHNWKPQIVHRDMKSLNLLVGDNWAVKVSDFGTSRFTEGAGVNLETLGKLRGTYAYCAPEVYFQQQFTPKSDIYSYGVILWELAYRCITGKYEQPFGEFKQIVFDFQIIVQSAKKDVRPTIPENCPPVYSNLINRCWHKSPEDRPTTEEIAEILQDMEKTYNDNKADWDRRRTVLIPN